jgi:hypothetical protein
LREVGIDTSVTVGFPWETGASSKDDDLKVKKLISWVVLTLVRALPA